MHTTNLNKNFFLRIVLPTLLIFVLFTISFFTLIIPNFESAMLKGKKEMISELTNSAWSILNDFNEKYESGLLSLDEAQSIAIEQIKHLRYGEGSKDYFWITDEFPTMIMHPYKPELDGTDLREYSDPEGKKLFVEFVKVVQTSGAGFVDYRWQWKDDSTRIVPKLSYVKEFESWNWIVGTGIYLEDVYQEIDNLINKLIYMSLGILFLAGIILFYLGRQSFKIEHERLAAESNLKESENKYRALVEASTDGLIMILEDKFVYANNALLEMLGYEPNLDPSKLEQIICRKGFEEITGIEYFNNLLTQREVQAKIEATLINKDNNEIDLLFYTSRIDFGKKTGFTIIVKDLSSSKLFEEELFVDRARFKTMTDSFNIGVFRSSIGKNNKFLESNSALLRIFGFNRFEDLYEIKLNELFPNEDEYNLFFDNLYSKGELNNRVLQIRKKNGSNSVVSVSAILVKDEKDNKEYCDGIIEDITDRIKIDEERENLIVELQTSLKYLHQPLENFLIHTVSCNMNSTIHEAAKIITKQKYSAALVKTDSGDYIGIVSDHDLRQRVVAENLNTNEAIHKVMSAPLISIPSNAFVFEALIQMREYSTRHLAVKNNEGKVIGIISSEELFKVERQSSAYLLREIDVSESIEELSEVKTNLPRLIKTLVDSGAKTKNITHIVTSIFDAIVHKIIDFAILKYGEPPCKFSFVALGSAGRKEQTLISDQDNAIIFENVDETELPKVKSYFDELAKFVCNGLDICGYDFCIGEAMANNTKWTQSLNTWENYFHKWIANSSQQDLIDISIYFDFRHVYGDSKLVDNLRSKLSSFTMNQAGFFQHLTKNCLLHKPPVGILGKLVLESKGEHAETFDMKLATMPISDFARIYALKYNLSATNTLERIQSLLSKGVISKNSYDELVQAYNFLMQLRFKHQATQITEDRAFDNFINPKELTQIEIKTLKNTFSHIVAIQKKLSYDFSGEAI
ncbi:MAG: cache domain-containing protein [Melioribacteraceae bacterium]|nr:cache domain-containing protein [Melioribacteraceae bacterium]